MTSVPAVTDDFNRADSTNLGVNWTERSGDWRIYSQTLRNISTGGDFVVTYTGTYTNTNVSADVKFNSSAGTIAIGARLGSFSGGVPTTGYTAELTTTGQVYLWRVSNWYLMGSYQIPNYQPGQFTNLLLSTSGSTIRVDVNGVTRITVTNTAHTSGSVGLWSYNASAANQHVCDNFNLVDLTQATATPTSTNTPTATATDTPTPTATASATGTVQPTNTPTSTPTPTETQAVTFPLTDVLDDFNRANGTIGNDWSGTTSAFTINNHQLQPLQGGSAIFWDSLFGAEQEAYVTFSQVYWDADEVDLLLKLQDTSDGVIEVWYDPYQETISVYTYATGQGWVQHGAEIAASFANGDVLGARASADGTVSVYKNGTLLGARDISSWPYNENGGYIGLWLVAANTAWRLDDFGGGSLGEQRQGRSSGEEDKDASEPVVIDWPSLTEWQKSQPEPEEEPKFTPVELLREGWDAVVTFVAGLFQPDVVEASSGGVMPLDFGPMRCWKRRRRAWRSATPTMRSIA